MNPTQQTADTITQRYDLIEALTSKKTPAETDKAIADYFAEKAARREARDASSR